MPPITKVSFGRKALRTIGWLALAFGTLGGVSRMTANDRPPLPNKDAICNAKLCEWDFKSDRNLRDNRPNFGMEKNCGASLLGSRLLDDHTIRYRIDVTDLAPGNPCTVKLMLDGQEITFADALSR